MTNREQKEVSRSCLCLEILRRQIETSYNCTRLIVPFSTPIIHTHLWLTKLSSHHIRRLTNLFICLWSGQVFAPKSWNCNLVCSNQTLVLISSPAEVLMNQNPRILTESDSFTLQESLFVQMLNYCLTYLRRLCQIVSRFLCQSSLESTKGWNWNLLDCVSIPWGLLVNDYSFDLSRSLFL